MPILEALVCETHSTALLTATIASAVNSFKRHDTERTEKGLKPYVPSEPALISVLRNGMLETDLDRDTIGVIVDFFDNLGPARSAIDQYFGDANRVGTERASALHLIGLSSSWRRACDDALVAVRQLHGYLGRLPSQVHEQLHGPHRVAAKRGARRLPLVSTQTARSPFPTCRSGASQPAARSASRARSRTIARPRRHSSVT